MYNIDSDYNIRKARSKTVGRTFNYTLYIQMGGFPLLAVSEVGKPDELWLRTLIQTLNVAGRDKAACVRATPG